MTEGNSKWEGCLWWQGEQKRGVGGVVDQGPSIQLVNPLLLGGAVSCSMPYNWHTHPKALLLGCGVKGGVGKGHDT